MLVRFPDGTEKIVRYGATVRGLMHKGTRPVYVEYTKAEVTQAFPHYHDKKREIEYHHTQVLLLIPFFQYKTHIFDYDPKTGLHSMEATNKTLEEIDNERARDKVYTTGSTTIA